MRIRAIAAPSDQSNAVGPLELECTPQGLLLIYLGVGAYSEGYAPGAVTAGTKVLVPWSQVEEVRSASHYVWLTLSPKATPHNKLCLKTFADGTRPPAAEVSRRRRILWVATGALAVTVALSVAGQWQDWFADGSQFGAMMIGLLSATAVLALGILVERVALGSGPDSDHIQSQFVAELSLFRPKPVIVGPVAGDRAPERLDWVDLIRFLPRSTFAIIIVLSATTLSLILTSNWLTRGSDERVARRTEAPAREPAGAEPASVLEAPDPVVQAATAVPPAEATTPPVATDPVAGTTAPDDAPAHDVITAGESCQCERADSALWSLEFPRLSTLLIEQKSRTHKDHRHLELELAVVNNGRERLREVNLMVQFYEDEGKRTTKQRPLHYPASLRPGQAIKWHVEARGTSFSVHNPLREVLESKQLADADAFAELLSANHRPVRLHAAMMLSFLGDNRAKGGALKLREALRESEAPYLDRVLATQGDILSCDWRASPEGRIRELSACVYNATNKRISNIGVKARALDRVFDYRNPVAPPPVVIAEKIVELEGSLEPQQGTQTVISLDTDNPDGKIPQTFELLADYDALL